MQLSKPKQTEAKRMDIPTEYLVMADLMSIGYSELDAFNIAHPFEVNPLAAEKKMKRILADVKFRNALSEKKRFLAETVVANAPTEDIELIDAEQTAKEILKVAQRMPDCSKERGEMYMKYANLIYKNEQGTDDIEDAISFFLPLKCNQCPLLTSYNKFLKEQGEKEVRPVEMDRVLRLSKQIIDKAKKQKVL